MGLNLKKILALSGGIAASVSTGGLAAPILIPAVLNLASEFAPDGQTDPAELQRRAEEAAREADLQGWERIKIVEWIEGYKTALDRGTGNLAQVFKGRLFFDFVTNYADPPEDDWLDAVHEMVAEAVRWKIANGIA